MPTGQRIIATSTGLAESQSWESSRAKKGGKGIFGLDHDTAIVLRHFAHSSSSPHDDIHCISHGSGTVIGKGS